LPNLYGAVAYREDLPSQFEVEVAAWDLERVAYLFEEYDPASARAA